jgi:ribosomal protein L22
VDGGPMKRNTRRFIPRAMGRASLIHKRTSHIKVVVSDETKN